MLLNNSELAAVKDCLKRYIEFNNNGLMSSYKVKQSNLLLMDEKEIEIDYKKMIVLKENKPIYRIIERYSNKTHKMLSRSLIDSLPESQPIDEFNLQEYINLVSDEIDSSETFEL